VFLPVKKRMKKLDLTKYKKKMSCLLEKLEIKSTSGFLPVKKRMKKLDLTKYKKKMRCFLEKNQNKYDFLV